MYALWTSVIWDKRPFQDRDEPTLHEKDPLLNVLSAFDFSSSDFLEFSKVERVVWYYQTILGLLFMP